jgi:hypothetical protein
MFQVDATTIAVVSVCFLAANFVIDKVFGGGMKYSSRFSAIEQKQLADIATLRMEFAAKISSIEETQRLGLDAIKSNIHLIQTAVLEFRLEMAKELGKYMLQDSFYRATDDLKRDVKDANQEIKNDMREGFERVEKTLDEMAQAIEAARQHNAQRPSPAN